MVSKAIRRVAELTLLWGVVSGGAGSAAAQVTASPTSISFGSVPVNVAGFAPRVTLTNNYSSSVRLTGITFGLPQYTVNTGLPVQTIPAKTAVQFGFLFMASLPGNYNNTITFNVKNLPPVVIQVSATAFTTSAATTLSANSLSFGNVAAGSTVTQPITVTNSGGPDSITITGVDIYYQPFSVTGPTTPVTLAPGQFATFQVIFSPVAIGSTTGSVTFCYTALPCNSADLSGTGIKPTGLAINEYPALPYATAGYAYQAAVTASGGVKPYLFRIMSGSLPAGITLAKSGAISGTVSSNASIGVYPITVQVQDSTLPKHLTATESMSLTLGQPTGANCNVTSVNVPGTNTPIIDLMDLGTKTYLNYEGGLYPNGSNTDPDPHHSDGLALAQGIQPLDANGNYDPNGSYVLISLGESASQQPFEQFITQANADPEKNTHLVIVNGAEGGATANVWTSGASGFWSQLIDYSLPFAGVTANQVVAAWVSDVNSQQNATFPQDAQTLQGDYETISNLLLQFFPNIKMMFFSSMNYTGYSQGISTTLPEPQSYESGFGPKWAIQDQINGVCCNYNSSNGNVVSPWMGWSFYYWGNGLVPRSDGITWSCQDINSDGLHPADPWGHIKIAQYLLNWFKTNALTSPWFLQPAMK